MITASAAVMGSARPSISPDGGWVAFESPAGILVADLQTGQVSPLGTGR
jgi:hypothetical protein